MPSKHLSDEFLRTLPDESLLALNAICTEFSNLDKGLQRNPAELPEYLRAVAIFRARNSLSDLKLGLDVPKPGDNPAENINRICNFFAQVHAVIIQRLNDEYLNRQTRKYVDHFSSEFAYVFSDDDYTRIQTLINELRDLITSSQTIADRHKRRLLERLERMQTELHRSTSDLDRFWGFIGEAGVVIGKFGTDIQPLVQRIQEIAEIVWKTIRVREQLLTDQNPISLPNPDSDR